MMTSRVTTLLHSLPALIVATIVILIIHRFVRALLDPLRDIRGPTLARYTRLWELYENWQGQFEHVTIALHKRYGRLNSSLANICTECFEVLSFD